MFLTAPMSPDTARQWYPGKHSMWADEARKAKDYLHQLQLQHHEGPPPVCPSYGFDAHGATLAWYSNHRRRIAEAEQMVADYAELLKEQD